MADAEPNMVVTTSEGGAFVVVAARLYDPESEKYHEWTMNFTPDDARDLAGKLTAAANEVDDDVG